ncbi:MAG: IS30 family transposase [Treponema sp.]|jgi:IS30 family transposase|nr:IS30 family transposase [Treponema sp.]
MKKNNSKVTKKYSHLSLEEREELAIGLETGMKQCEIALMLQRAPSTISREMKRNNPSVRLVRYRANRAQLKADERKTESHARERIPSKRLRNFICKHIRIGYSPEIVAVMAAKKNKRWKTNYETIYQWIYNDRQDLIPFLTKSHKKRRKRGAGKQKRCVKISNRTMIEQRPGHVNLRSRVGHWEADTAISRNSKAAIMVLAERRTRYVIIKKLDAKTAFAMHNATVKSLGNHHSSVRRSITYDNGTENALHELTNRTLGVKSYFCNPYHSWEKGTVENMIGIIRRFYPKKTDWKNVTQWDLNKVARFINNRPMKLLGFKTPCQVFVALTA